MSFGQKSEEHPGNKISYTTTHIRRFTLNFCSITDEDLIKHILADGQNFFSQTDESEMADL